MAERKDTVIVIGSSGFIGEALLAQLVASYNVVGLDLHAPKELRSVSQLAANEAGARVIHPVTPGYSLNAEVGS